MPAEQLLGRAQQHVQQLYTLHHQPHLIYHNLTHTTEVVRHAVELSIWHRVNRLDTFIVSAAAWFHDTGHLFTTPEYHEAKSTELMRGYFTESGLDNMIIDSVADCIMATQAPWQPVGLLQEIICDADTYHLGTENFWDINCTVWMEEEARMGHHIPDWKARSLAFLGKHRYFTKYCDQLLTPGKADNILRLQTQLDDGKGPCP